MTAVTDSRPTNADVPNERMSPLPGRES
jgi:hypothetical protein